ncbi:MAG: hypothetical protein ACRDD1_18785, partial [Planctomycetia bacterium]
LLGWTTDNADPDNFVGSLLDRDRAVPPHANNISFYKSDAVHDLIVKAAEETDETTRAALYHQAQKIVHEDCPMVTLMHLELAVGARKHVQGYKVHPTGLVRLRTARLFDAATATVEPPAGRP